MWLSACIRDSYSISKGCYPPWEKKPSPLRCEITQPGKQMAQEEATWNNSEAVGVRV